MGNRRKPRNKKLRALGKRMTFHIPDAEQTVEKTVPAIIHWSQVPGVTRNDDETVGEAVVYEDGTTDVILFKDISDEAHQMISGVKGGVDHYSIMDTEEN